MRRQGPILIPLFLALVGSQCQCRSDGQNAKPSRPAKARKAPAPPQARPARAAASARQAPAMPRPSGIASALDLPNAPGVTPLTADVAASLPYVKVPVARIVAQARKHCQTHWYGLYLGGRKLGYAEMSCAVKRLQGRTVLERRSRMVMKAKMYNQTVHIKMDTIARFATTGRGELLDYDYSQSGVQQQKTLRLKRKADGWHLLRTYRAGAIVKPPERQVIKRLSADLERSEAALSTLLVEGKLQPGHKYRFVEFDPEEAKVQDSAGQLLASGERRLRGVPVKLHKMEVLELKRRLRGVTIVDAGGNWLDGSLQGTIRIKREERATAMKVDPKAGDFGLGVVIKAPLGVSAPPRTVRVLKLQLTGFLPAGLLESKRHHVVKQGTQQAELTVTRESLTGLIPARLPVKLAKLAKALKATHVIEANHPVIRGLARRAVGRERNALAAARKINTFVFQYLRKSLSTNLDSALAIARARAGDCTEHARLMVALCRAVGLPAREVGGVTYVPELKGFGYHAWVEVWVGKWVSADPSWDELPANATHIHMGGPDDVQWVGTLGALKLKVLSVKTR